VNLKTSAWKNKKVNANAILVQDKLGLSTSHEAGILTFVAISVTITASVKLKMVKQKDKY
jgi:hypothetical protein